MVNRNNIRLVVILGAICLAGITATQVYWIKKVFDINETQFDVNVSLGLKNVSDSIAFETGVKPFTASPVSRLTSNYFIVNQLHSIDPALLERYLKNEFTKRGLQQNFGLVMFEGDRLTYSKCITFRTAPVDTMMLKQIPNLSGAANLSFGIYFPAKAANLASGMYIWIFSSCVLLIVVTFFAYAMLVILKQKRLSEVQRDFVNNMAHEFQTPISAIMASAEVIKNPVIIEQPQRLANYAGIIDTEIRKLSNQVQRVLEMAGAESESIALNKTQVDVHHLLVQTVSKFIQNTGLGNEDIALHLNAIEHIISADALHLANVVYNLLDNAIKYSTGKPSISINTSSEKNGVVITVKDKGIGIDRNDLKKIFNKFYRVSQGNRHDVKGFGLGLSYVKLMVEAHRGTIDVKSKLNAGTTFILFFPFK
jgi:two-component system, OmpR family, phosphate regulon sensor histidine kinase PhoR